MKFDLTGVERWPLDRLSNTSISWVILHLLIWGGPVFSIKSVLLLQVACQSKDNALIFHSSEREQELEVYQFVTTHDLNLYMPASDLILEEHIDHGRPPSK